MTPHFFEQWSRSPLPQTAKALWQFSRPHTIIGTSLSVLALAAIALAQSPTAAVSPLTVAIAWVACLGGNIYIVGLNQLEDIEIDRINKPHLPLAAGVFSPAQGRGIVITAGIGAIALALTHPWLLFTVGISLIIGTAYSLPPIRLKRFSLWAALCILTVRGGVVNVGLYRYFQGATGGIPGPVWVLTGFILWFTIAIALFKDVPDLDGDRQYRIQTVTILLGKRAVFRICCGLIVACYGAMIGVGLLGIPGINGAVMIATHTALAIALLWRSRGVDLAQKPEIARFYQFIWLLFFLEYLLFPLACWWA
ncbi:homogentisate phytyltransferase [Spirulina major]|uniref:homogentisate phytyltransferase n=1 Tax=Spirulina major TaxID=270636 RepID=UPI000933EBB6|nr:homogentisate phytyltransferase [Spirulina major]